MWRWRWIGSARLIDQLRGRGDARPATGGCWGGRADSGEPVFGVEGCGSYGAGLARFLGRPGVPVYECERPRRGERGAARTTWSTRPWRRAGWSAARG